MSTPSTLRDETALRRLLDEAEIVPLTMALVHLTGDESLLSQIRPYVRGPWEHQILVPDRLASEIRDRMAAQFVRFDSAGRPAIPELAPDLVQEMMGTAAGEAINQHYVAMLREDMLAARESDPVTRKTRSDALRNFQILIIGAGASGLCAAIRLGQLGIPYVLLEKNQDVGGTWYENRYPGCAVDLPSHFYQYSFEPNHEWPHYYAKQPSVLDYFSRCADKYSVRQHARFGCEVESATYDEEQKSWTVLARERSGAVQQFQANAIICAVGQLNRPAVPKFVGLENFEGESFHTATWPHGTDLQGKLVALVGTGPSAVQVGPAIAEKVASLHVFQRSGSWVARRTNIDRNVSENIKWILCNVPFYAAWYRFQLFWAFGDGLYDAFKVDPKWADGNNSFSEVNAKHRAAMMRYIERELEGREDLLGKIIPKYPPFSKRVIADPGWYKMFRRPHVYLIETAIQRIERDGVRTADGAIVHVDTIIFATGFQAGRMLWPMDIRGRHGQSIRNAWGDDNPRAYLGTTVPEFPNLFILYGPNSNFAHGGSAIFLAECQVNYILNLLNHMADAGYAVAEVRKEVHDEYNRVMDENLRMLVWSRPDANSWYKNAAGRIVTNQPWRLVDYWQLTRKPVVADYHFEGR